MAEKVLAQFGEKKVVTCFAFKCPRRWEAMEKTANEKLRSCSSCLRTVHFAETESEFEALRDKGECVAVWSQDPSPEHPSESPLLYRTLGIPARPDEFKAANEWTQKNEENSKKSWLDSLFRFFSLR